MGKYLSSDEWWEVGYDDGFDGIGIQHPDNIHYMYGYDEGEEDRLDLYDEWAGD